MRNLTLAKEQQLKIALNNKIEEFLEDNDLDIGWLPDDLAGLMTHAAFCVLETVEATNDYIESERLLKES